MNLNSATRALLDLQTLEFSRGAVRRSRTRRPKGKAQCAIVRLRRRIPVQMLREYDTRKRRYGAFSLVPVSGEICSGCHVALSRRTLYDSSVRPTECEHCARLVYNPSRRQPLRIEIHSVPDLELELAG